MAQQHKNAWSGVLRDMLGIINEPRTVTAAQGSQINATNHGGKMAKAKLTEVDPDVNLDYQVRQLRGYFADTTLAKLQNILEWARVKKDMDEAVEGSIYTLPVNEISYEKSGPNAGKLVIRPVTIPDPLNKDREIPLVLDKLCLAAGANLEAKGVDFSKHLRYFHCYIGKGDADPRMLLTLQKFWDREGVVPFGNGLKPDENGRVKFFTLPSDVAALVFGENIEGEWSTERSEATGLIAYGTGVLSEARKYRHLRCLVLSREELEEKMGYWPGIDGSGYIRPGETCQVRGLQNMKDGSIAFFKGVLDDGRFSNKEFDELFGVEWDAVIIRGDMIKINSDIARSGLWVVAYTHLTDRAYEIPFMWELTQFVSPHGKVREVFKGRIKSEIRKVYQRYSDKRSAVAHLIRKIEDALAGEKHDAIVLDTKLLLMLISAAPMNQSWIQAQLDRYMLIDMVRAVRSYGVIAYGQLCLIDDREWKKNPRYISIETAAKLGADTDGDLIGRLLDKSSRKALYFRYPVVDMPAIVDLGVVDTDLSECEDVHPEIIDIYQEFGVKFGFSRNDLKSEKIIEPISHAPLMAMSLIKGTNVAPDRELAASLEAHGIWNTGVSSVGANTVWFKRLMSHFHATPEDAREMLEKFVASAQEEVEYVTVGFKKYVHGLSRASWDKETHEAYKKLRKVLRETYSLSYRSFNPKTWDQVSLLKYEDDFDAELYNYGIGLMLEAHKHWKSKAKAPVETRVYTHTAADTNVSKAFMDRIKDARNIWNSGIGLWRKEKDEDKKALIMKRLIASVRSLSETMTVGEKALAVEYDYHTRSNSATYTGAFGVHLAGEHILDIFGIDPMFGGIEVKADLRQSKSPVRTVRAFNNKTVTEQMVSALRAAVAAGNARQVERKLVFGDIYFTLTEDCEGEVVDIMPYKKGSRSILVQVQ